MGGMTYVLGTSNSSINVDVRNPANQLRLVVYPIIYRGFIHSTGGYLGFLKHHQCEVGFLAMVPWRISSPYGLASSWS